MNTKENPFSALGKRAVLTLAGLALAAMTVTLLGSYGLMELDQREHLVFLSPGAGLYLLALAAAVLLYAGRGVVRRVPEGLLFGCLALGYLAAGAYLIACTEPTLRGDNLAVYQIALNLKNGSLEDFAHGSYLQEYPQQLGLALYEALLLCLTESPRVLFAANLVLVVLSLFFLWKTHALFQPDPQVRNYGLLFGFGFLPQLFFVLMAYGEIPGGCLLSASLYGLCLGSRRARYRHWVWSVAALALCCAVRKNFWIAAIALCALALLTALRNRQWQAGLLALCLLGGAWLGPRLPQLFYARKTGVDLADCGVPPVTFIAMGLQTNDVGKQDGWYNGYNSRTWRQAGCDTETAARLSAPVLKQRLEVLSSHPEEALRFFHRKAASMWCDPLFECIWSGPLESCGQYTTSRLTQNLYEGRQSYRALYAFMYAFLLLCYLSVLLETVWRLKRQSGWEAWELFGLLFFLGAFLFHLVWEASGQYVYINLPFLTPLAAEGFCRLCGLVDRLFRKRR